jgi:hypothetical protein
MLTFMPIAAQINLEQQILKEQRYIQSKLYDDLQTMLWTTTEPFPITYERLVKEKQVTFTFSQEQLLIKGCAKWTNAKQKEKIFCLYGHQVN